MHLLYCTKCTVLHLSQGVRHHVRDPFRMLPQESQEPEDVHLAGGGGGASGHHHEEQPGAQEDSQEHERIGS